MDERTTGERTGGGQDLRSNRQRRGRCFPLRDGYYWWLSAALLGGLTLAGCAGSDGSTAPLAPANPEVPGMTKTSDDYTPKSDEYYRKTLSPLEYKVMWRKGTEPPFDNEYWDSKTPGLFVCRSCGLPLFKSETKYESGTGWPSFYAPISEANVKTQDDSSFFTTRTEVLCKRCEAHLGHVFEDGPQPTGLRYCMNSAALKLQPESSDASQKDPIDPPQGP